MLIDIQGLSKAYSGGKYALRDINLKIESGMFGLLGPNGAGKTTLMRILVTLLKPTTGTVMMDGLNLQKARRQIRKMVGYLPQDFSTFSRLAVWEFLDYAARLSGVRSKKERSSRIDRLLDDVGLYTVRDRRSDKLSGGMKRRLGIAQTLIGQPRIMVVDEPTVGLDPEERLRFRNLLADLTRTDMVIILSTHIVGDISSTCSHIALLNDGEIVFGGTPDVLMHKARGKVWKVVVSDLELDLIRIKYPVISAIPSTSGYEVRVVADKVENHSAEETEPNLEDAYIYYMQSIGYDMNMETSENLWEN